MTARPARPILFLKTRTFKGRPGYRLERHRWHLAIKKEGEANGGGGWRVASVTLPSSAGLSTLDEARTYWQAHFGGKTMPLTVHLGEKEHQIRVFFDAGNTHAYTDSQDEHGRKLKSRVFSEKRARAMSRIPSVIEQPKIRLINHGSRLFIEGRQGGEHYTIVLSWRESSRLFEFQSAHFKPVQEVVQLQRHRERKNDNGPL